MCILRLSAIGDVCHAASMVSRIRRTRPDIRLVWLIGKVEYELVAGMAGVDFMVFDKKANRADARQFKKQLQKQRFDAVCIMQVALRANWLSRSISAPIKLGFDKAHSKEGHSFFINRRIAKLTHPHVLEGFHAFADALAIPRTDKLYWDIPLADIDTTFANALFAEQGPFVALCPAASKPERNWLPKHYAETAKYCQKLGYEVVICGGPGQVDRDIEEQIQQYMTTKLPSIVAQTTLKTLLAVLAKAELVIAPDTGPAHMATAVGTPVVGLYAHSNYRRTGPYLSQKNVVSVYEQQVQQQFGKKWHQLKWGTRAKGGDLMESIELKSVTDKIHQLLPTLR